MQKKGADYLVFQKVGADYLVFPKMRGRLSVLVFCNRPEYLVSQNGGPEYLEGQNWRARIPGKSKVRGRLPRPHFGKKWTRLPGGPDYLVAAKSGPDYLGAVDWGSQKRGAPFCSFGRFSPSRTRARADDDAEDEHAERERTAGEQADGRPGAAEMSNLPSHTTRRRACPPLTHRTAR